MRFHPTLTGSEVPTLQAQVHFSGIVPKAVGASRWPRVGGFPASVGECLALVASSVVAPTVTERCARFCLMAGRHLDWCSMVSTSLAQLTGPGVLAGCMSGARLWCLVCYPSDPS